MKQILLSALLCFFSYLVSHAQAINPTSIDTIKGIVTDSATKSVLSHVTVEAKELENNQIIKSILTNENGFFEIITSYRNNLRVLFSYPGYRSVSIKLNPSHLSSINLGQIAMVSVAKQLPEIQVTSIKPILEQDLDKLTYNVDADPDSKTATTLDILRKIPMLSIDADDNLQLNGNSSFRILINGKPSLLFFNNQSDIFKSMPASMLKKIEVITVPSSKYEAQGVGGIINLTTYSKNISGYNGGLDLRLNTPKGLTANGNMSANAGMLSFNGNITYNNNTSPVNSSNYLRQDKLKDSRLVQQGSGNNNSQFQNLGTTITYELNNLNSIVASYSKNNGHSKNVFSQQSTLMNAAETSIETLKNKNSGNNQSHGNGLALDYQRSFRKNEARQFTLSYKWSNYASQNTTDFTRQPLVNNKAQLSNTDNKDATSEHTLQADYVQPIKKHTLELGTHAIFRQNSSDYFYKNLDMGTGAFVLDSSQSNIFNYREAIYAAYTSLNLKAGKWGLRIGARLELANMSAHFTSSGTTTIQNYRNLVPNLTLSHQLKGISRIKLSYSQRLQRPDLYYLNPYIDRTDLYNISYGNPDLQPAIAHVFNLSYNTYIKKTFITMDVFHQFTNNAIEQFSMLGTDTITRTTFSNIGKSRSTNLSLSGNTTLFRNLTASLNSTANYVQYTSNINGKPYTNGGFTFNISGSVNYRYKGWRTGCNMSYYAPNVLLQGRTASYVSNSITVNKYLLKNNKLNVGLSVTSPLQKHRRSLTEIEDPSFYQMRQTLVVIRRFNLSFNYRFEKISH